MPGIGLQRPNDFEDYLRANNVPINGISVSGTVFPASITIDFQSVATAEQIAWANAAKDSFDWRERRLLARNQIATGLQGLTTAQRNAIITHMIASFIREHKAECNDALAVAGIALPIDEVSP